MLNSVFETTICVADDCGEIVLLEADCFSGLIYGGWTTIKRLKVAYKMVHVDKLSTLVRNIHCIFVNEAR